MWSVRGGQTEIRYRILHIVSVPATFTVVDPTEILATKLLKAMELYVHDHGRFCHLECWGVERKFERCLLRREESDIDRI